MRQLVARATTLAVSIGAAAVFAEKQDSRLVAWVELGPDGQAIARAITSERRCPVIRLDHRRYQMSLRVGAETIPARPTDLKPSEFPVTTCEYLIPPGTQSASVSDQDEDNGEGGDPRGDSKEHRRQRLPLPKPNPQRIVILGDTGCRLHIGDPWQSCFDPEEWPLETIAQTAAGLDPTPDLVIHVGDYHYRENECPPDIGGCQGSPWGYGWDVWDADLFTPARELLAAAPWIMVRGNHEECVRAGQGWYRFLDTQPYQSLRTCNDPENYAIANYSDPYAVPIGDDTQLILFDSSKVTTSPLDPSDPAFLNYQDELRQVEALPAANPNALSIWANHHPLLAFSPVTGNIVTGGNPALLSVMYATYNTQYYPPGIDLALHGHTHMLQILNFSTDHPATFMVGNGGDNLAINLPDPFPLDAHPDGDFGSAVNVEEIAYTSTFGFVVADKDGDGEWTFQAYTRRGGLLTTCTFVAGHSSCSDTGFLHERNRRISAH